MERQSGCSQSPSKDRAFRKAVSKQGRGVPAKEIKAHKEAREERGGRQPRPSHSGTETNSCKVESRHKSDKLLHSTKKSTSSGHSARHGSPRESTLGKSAFKASCKELEEQRKLLKRKARLEEKPESSQGSRHDYSVSEEPQKRRRKSPSETAHRPEPKQKNSKERRSQDSSCGGSLTQGLRDQRRRLVHSRRSTWLDGTEDRRSSQGERTRHHLSDSAKETSTPAKHPGSESSSKVAKHVDPKWSELKSNQKSAAVHHTDSGKSPSPLPSLPKAFKISRRAGALLAKTSVWDSDGDDKAGVVRRKYSASVSKLIKGKQLGPVPEKTPACSSSAYTQQPMTQGAVAESLASTDDDYQMELVEELLLARSEKRLQVNMVERYGELTCMDIDPPEEGTIIKPSKQHHLQDLLIVLDTNIFLSHLDFVKKVMSHGLGGLGFPTLLVPWVVLQELDSLKSGRLSSQVELKARPAVHYIYSCLKSLEPRLWGQSMQQAAHAICGLEVENNDDRVLQCCLQYQSLCPGATLLLCTNDKNLCSKSLLCGVKALTKADLVLEMENHRPVLQSHTCVPPTPPSTGHGQRGPPPPQQQICVGERRPGDEEEARKAAEEALELSVGVCELEASLHQPLCAVLQEEMKAVYGELWLEIVYLKPPWSLMDALQCFQKHWIAVFGNIVKRSLLSCVESLSDTLKPGKAVDRLAMQCAVREAVTLLSALGELSRHGGHVAEPVAALQTLQQRLKPGARKALVEQLHDEDALMVEAEEAVPSPAPSSAQGVWTLFESIWAKVCQTRSAVFTALRYHPGSMETTPSVATAPPQDALTCLHRLSTAVKCLLEAFQRLLAVTCSIADAQSFLTFVLTNEIAPTDIRVSASDLLKCLSQQEYREKLCVGGAQLAELSSTLDRCSAAVGGRSEHSL